LIWTDLESERPRDLEGRVALEAGETRAFRVDAWSGPMPSAAMQTEQRDVADWDPAIGSLYIQRNSTEYDAKAHHVVDGNASDFEIVTDRGHQRQ